MYQYNLLYFANYYTLSNVYSMNLQYLHLICQRWWQLRTVFQFRQLIIYKVIQFLQLLCFLSCCSSHSVRFCCNFSAWSEKSSAEADRASASVCSTLLFTFNSLTSSVRVFLFLPATTWVLHFYVLPGSICTVQQQLFVTDIDVVNANNRVNVVTNHSLSCKCRCCHVFTSISLLID